MVLVPSSNVRNYSGVLLAISRYRICGDMRPFKSNQVIGQWGLFSKVVSLDLGSPSVKWFI